MRRENPSTTSSSVPMPSLSEVTIQYRLNSAGGVARGHELVRAELDRLLSRPDVSFALSSEQKAHYEAALQFLTDHYASLGLQFHSGGNPFVFSRRGDESGICMTISRSPGVKYAPFESRAEWESIALWVHELTHATASVLWGASRSTQGESGWEFAISRAGYLMWSRSSRFPSLNRVQQGLLFEEYAACSNESSYHRSFGADTETVSESSLHLPVGRSRDADVRIFRLFAQVCDPTLFRQVESSNGPRRWERALILSSGPKEVPIPAVSWKRADSSASRSTYDLLPLVDELAKEIFPELPPAQASEKLRATTIEAHATGRLSRLFIPIREALGGKALRFLLQWGTDFNNLLNGEDTAMLALFVKAGALGPSAARAVRGELLDALLERRNRKLFSEKAGSLQVEELVVAAENGRWEGWLTKEARSIVAGNSELQDLAAAGFQACIDAKKLSQAATIATAAALLDHLVPSVPRKELVIEAKRLLASGSVDQYARLVGVFKPKRPLVPATELRSLIHAAALRSLEEGYPFVFCEVAVSPLCDRAALLTPQVMRLAQRFLAGQHSAMSKARLDMALRGEKYPD